jgi:hypothetical protein
LKKNKESLSSILFLERARDRAGDSETAWCTDYWQGKCPGRGWWWSELKEAKKPPASTKITKTASETSSFAEIMPKTPFFAQMSLIRYNAKMFFEEYINFNFFFLLQALWSYTYSKFWESYRPPAIRIKVFKNCDKYQCV